MISSTNVPQLIVWRLVYKHHMIAYANDIAIYACIFVKILRIKMSISTISIGFALRSGEDAALSVSQVLTWLAFTVLGDVYREGKLLLCLTYIFFLFDHVFNRQILSTHNRIGIALKNSWNLSMHQCRTKCCTRTRVQIT